MKAAKLIGVILLSAACFGAGALTAGMRHWFKPVVHVRIDNRSGEDLESLMVVHESAGLTSTVTMAALKDGQSAHLNFFVQGEGGYQVQARFAGGRVVKGGAGYVEAGSTATEVIGKSGIRSD